MYVYYIIYMYIIYIYMCIYNAKTFNPPGNSR